MNQYFSGRAYPRSASLIINVRSLSLSFLLVVSVFAATRTQAQTSNEFFSTSMGSIPNGPTTNAQTARLLLNTDNISNGDTVGTTNIDVRLTASLSNQQYTGFSTGTGNPVVMFGANSGTTGGPSSVPVFGAMSSIGSPTSPLFSNTPSGTAQGMNVAVNRAFDLFTSVRHWAAALPLPPPTNARVHMADLTLTFSSPVTNPRLQFVGMGGTTGGLGFGSEFTLITPGLSLTKIQGNTDLVVTATEINNGNTTIDASCGVNASCGTVRVNGSNITTVTFRVYVRGDGGGSSWSGTTSHPGDRWMFAVSLPESYSLSGNVFFDTDGAGTINGTGISMPNGAQLYATLVDPTDNTVLGSIPVNSDGTYSFNGIPGGGVNYRVEISTNQGTALAGAPASELPSGWNSVGENLGAGAGNDGLADRALNVTVNSANLTNANFGISMAPTAANVSVSGRVLTPDGMGLRGAYVILTDSEGNSRTAVSSTFGFYRFDEVEAGVTYIVSVSSKRYQFEPRVVTVHDEIADLDFTALE